MDNPSARAVRAHNERLKSEIRVREAVTEADGDEQRGVLASFRALNDTGQRLVLGVFVAAFIFSAWWGFRPRQVYQLPPESVKVESAHLVQKANGVYVEGVIRNTSGQRVKRVVFEASCPPAKPSGRPAIDYIVAHDLAAGQAFPFSQLFLPTSSPIGVNSELQIKPFAVEY